MISTEQAASITQDLKHILQHHSEVEITLKAGDIVRLMQSVSAGHSSVAAMLSALLQKDNPVEFYKEANLAFSQLDGAFNEMSSLQIDLFARIKLKGETNGAG